MEGLEANRLREIRRVCMRWKGDIGICCICHGQVGSKVVETAIMSDADEGYPLKQFLCRLRGVVGRARDEGKAVRSLMPSVRTYCLPKFSWTQTIRFVRAPTPRSDSAFMTES